MRIIENRSDFVNSLAKGLAVIACFDSAHPELTISEVAELNDLSRASARRILLTLTALGYVRERGAKYSLSPKTLSLGYGFLASEGVADVIAPRIAELSADIRESVSAAVLDGSEIVYVARSAPAKVMQIRIAIGTRFPAAATSLGRALMSDLPEGELIEVLKSKPPQMATPFTKTAIKDLMSEMETVRKQDYAFVDQELELGLKSISVPVRGASREIVAAINIATVGKISKTTLERSLLPALKACAREIEAELGLL
jgi:IclR family pca regulon transcriptional regulator